MKTFVICILIMLLTGCGVSTDSSDYTIAAASSNVDSNSTDTNDTTDSNSTSTVVETVDNSDDGFDKTDAELDEQGCLIDATYQVIDDSSFDPLSAVDNDNGVEVSSKYDYSTDLEATKVALFYPNLNKPLVGTSVNVYEDLYRFGYDKAWINNDITTVYIRTPKGINQGYGCYRYELSSLDGASVIKTKVYR